MKFHIVKDYDGDLYTTVEPSIKEFSEYKNSKLQLDKNEEVSSASFAIKMMSELAETYDRVTYCTPGKRMQSVLAIEVYSSDRDISYQFLGDGFVEVISKAYLHHRMQRIV